ncbi:MAG: hypothetical protein ACQEQS_01470 [Thermodesulfobacteriota bacterium]
MKKEENKTKGVAALFDHIEIKSFLKNYLIFIGIVEAIIFFVCFVEQLESGDSPFPWKNYFFASFIIPVVITFLLGILVAGFNKYLYGSIHESFETNIAPSDTEPSEGYIKKIESVLQLFQKLPFLLTLFILSLAAGIIYKLDSIIMFITQAGQKSLYYLSVFTGIITGVAVLFTIIWLILNYKLKKKDIEYRHAYKESVVKQLGMVILDDDTLIDKNGKVVSVNEKQEDPEKLKNSNSEFNLLESFKKNKDE